MRRGTTRMLSILLVLCMALTLLPEAAWAADTSGKCGNSAYWSFDANSGTLTISGTGAMYDYNYDVSISSDEAAPWLDPYSNDIAKIVISEGITHIGDWSFGRIVAAAAMPNLTSISIADTVTSIGDGAFYDNTPNEIYLPASVRQVGTDESGLTSDGDVFEGGSLQAIYVDESNPCYKSIGGVLYKRGSNPALIRYPARRSASELVLPKDIEVLNMASIPERELSVHVPSTVNTVTNIAEAASKVYFYSNAPETFSFFHFTDPYRSSILTIYYPSSASGWDQVIDLYNNSNYRNLKDNNLIRFETWTPGEFPSIERINDSISDDPQPLLPPKSGQFKYYSSFTDKTEQYTYYYDESWFLNESTTYNHNLATMSLNMAMAAFDVGSPDRAANIRDLYEKLGFEYTDDSIVYETPGTDTIGYAIGSKTVSSGEDTFTLIAVAIRGGNYEQEWASNFTVGTTSEHAGFANAADTVVTAIRNHIQSIGVSQNLKIWITGYSRAAATTNIATQRLNYLAKANSIRGLSKENIFAYCFECPQTVQTSSPSYDNIGSNNNIFNIVNYIDIVTKVAPSKWDFSRYGITYYLPSAEQSRKFSSAYETMLNEYAYILNRAGYRDGGGTAITYGAYVKGQGSFFDETADAMASYFRNQSVYTAGYQDVMRRIGRNIGDGGVDGIASALVEGIFEAFPAFAPLHPIITTKLLANVFNLAHAHYPELCLAWMNALDGKNDFVDSRTRRLKINCPVNIEVEDSEGFPVAQIIDDTVIELEGSTIAAYIDEDDQKVIVLPVDEEYTVKLVATDNGTVTYTATEYNIDTADIERVVSYYEVDVVKGDELTGIIENLEDESAVYPLYLNENKESLKATIDQSGDDVTKYTVAVTTTGNGTVFGGGPYVNGEFAKVIAEPDSGETFLGWYINSELVSSELEYRFLVDDDIVIVARFTTNTSQSSGGSSGGNPSYQITVPATPNGTVTVTPTSAKSGTKVTITATPNDGYTTSNVTVTDRNGKSISVTDNGDGTYTFTMPASQVTVSVTFSAIETTWVNPFNDVSESHWFYEYVAYVVQNGLMKGEGNGQFNPSGTTTRGMIMTILARLAGVDTSGSSPWYQVSMEWAVTEGVSDGTSPEAEITREQLATMLWRYAGEPAATGDLSAYPDAGDVHADWAGTAMIWAVENGIINGSDGKLNPQGNALRSEAAAMLTRYCQNIKK